jgi:hypothetical protein
LADPIWWAEQQLKLVTAAATYLTRVTQAVADTAAPQALETGPVPAIADETPVPAIAETPPAPAVAEPDEPAVTTPEEEPPVPRWDELSLGSIRARLRRLSEADLVTLHSYEERHESRPDVLSLLANRLIKVRQNGGPAAG